MILWRARDGRPVTLRAVACSAKRGRIEATRLDSRRPNSAYWLLLLVFSFRVSDGGGRGGEREKDGRRQAFSPGRLHWHLRNFLVFIGQCSVHPSYSPGARATTGEQEIGAHRITPAWIG
jgi:hypothetical protein